MARPLLTNDLLSVFENARFEPFLDQSDDARVADPMLHEANQPILADFVEKASDVGVQYVVHLRTGDADHQGIQRIMLAAFRSKSVREPEELLLVDHAQHRRRRSLHNLIFESDDR